MTVHLLKANGAKKAPFADAALCGQPVEDGTQLGIAAFWPGEKMIGSGRWCRECKALEKADLTRTNEGKANA